MSVVKEANAAKMAAGPGLAPHTTRDFALHRPPFEDFAPWTARDFAGTSGQAPLVADPARGAGQAGSSTPGSFAVVLCWCLKEPAAIQYREPWHALVSARARTRCLLGLREPSASEVAERGED